MEDKKQTNDHELKASRNFAWNAFGQIILRILGMAFFIYMSSRLLETGMGKYGFIGSFVVMWFIFSDFGIGGYLFREWSKHEKPFSEIESDFYIDFTIKTAMASLIFIPFIIINYFINQEIFLALILAYISTFLAIYINLADAFLQSNNNFKNISIRQIIEKTVTVVLGSALLYMWPKVENIFVALIISQIASLIYYYATTLPFKFRLIFNWDRIKYLIVKGIPFLFIVFFTSIYSRIDMIMLRFMDSFEVVGWYTTAYRFIDIAALFPAVLFIPAIFTILSSLYHQKKSLPDFDNFFYKAARIMFSSGLIITLIFIFFSPQLISILFPASFGPTILALRILILVTIISCFSLLFNNLLIIQGKEKIGLYIIIMSACFNIILNLILIPRYSLYGAAWATVIAEIANVFLLQHFTVWKKDNKFFLKLFLVGTVNTVILVLMKLNGEMNNLFIGSLVTLINLVVLYKIKLIQKDDIKFFIKPFFLKIKSIINPPENI